jgi:hypothetical protein
MITKLRLQPAARPGLSLQRTQSSQDGLALGAVGGSPVQAALHKLAEIGGQALDCAEGL